MPPLFHAVGETRKIPDTLLGSLSPRSSLLDCRCKSSDNRSLMGRCVPRKPHLGPPSLSPAGRYHAAGTLIGFAIPAEWQDYKAVESPWLVSVLFTIDGITTPNCAASVGVRYVFPGETDPATGALLPATQLAVREAGVDLKLKYALCHPLFQESSEEKTYTAKGLLAEPELTTPNNFAFYVLQSHIT